METVRQNSGAGGSLVTNDFTIMGNGINRPDGTGGYVECKPVVMSYPEGLVCTGATYSVIIGADLRSGVVDFQSGDQQRIVFRPLGIAFHDRESGKSVWLASVKSCSAEVISNSVVFRDAFEGNGVEASLVYEYRAGRFSQSVIFSKSLAVSPEDFGMTAGRIELITEFLQSPAPTVTEHVLQSEQVSAKRAGMAEPDVLDQTLKFGGEDGMVMPLGRAFPSGAATSRGIPVAKQFLNVDDRTLIVESMDWNEVKTELDKLPASSANISVSNMIVTLKRKLPARTAQAFTTSFAAHLAQVTSADAVPGAYASVGLPRGFIADFELLDYWSGWVLESGHTYLVTGSPGLCDVTFEAGAVINFERGASLFLSGSLEFGLDGPRIFLTGVDDDTVGEDIDGEPSTLSGSYADIAMTLESCDADVIAGNLEIRNATEAISAYDSSLFVYYSRIRDGEVGISGYEASVYLDGVEACNVTTPLSTSSCTVYGEMLDCNHDSDSDGLPDLWERDQFGNLDQSGGGDYDGDGVTILSEYLSGKDPNIIQFLISVTNQYVRTSSPAMQLNVLKGVPSGIAVLVDSTNFAAANWTSYSSSSVNVSLGTNEAWHSVWIGLRGRLTTSQQTWQWRRLKLDLTPPLLVITNPVSTALSRPMIQVQGYSTEVLASLSYDLTNAAGLFTQQQCFVVGQYYNTNLCDYTTNYFQCFDIRLTNGDNTISVQATDLAGNVSTTNLTFVIDFSMDTNPPAIKVWWPQDGTAVGTSNFTSRGWVDDATATVIAQAVDSTGSTNSFPARVGRDGNFWIEGIPLDGGINGLTLIATNSAGQVSMTNISIVKGEVDLTIDQVDWSSASGTIGSTNYTVWVNGVEASIYDHGSYVSWSANTPLDLDHTSVHVQAIPNENNEFNNNQSVEADTEFEIPSGINYENSCHYTEHHSAWPDFLKDTFVDWSETEGGRGKYYYHPNFDPSHTLDWRFAWLPGRFIHFGPGYTNDDTNMLIAGVPSADDWEYCEAGVNRPDVIGGEIWQRTSHQELTLVSGGKAGDTEPILIIISGAGRAGSNPPRYGPTTGDPGIPPENIMLASIGPLDTNGLRAITTPPRTQSNITPKVADSNQYWVWLTGTRYQLVGQCVATTPTNRTRLDLGVGEEIDLSFSPLGIPLEAHWTCTAGHVGTRVGDKPDGKTVLFTAPSNQMPATVTAAFPGGAKIEITFNIIEPTGVDHVVVTSTNFFNTGVSGAGMHLTVYLAPTNVSFYRITCKEIGQDASERTGYYTNFSASYLGHTTARGANAPISVNPDNSWNHTWDIAAWSGDASPWTDGGFTWVIPGKWYIGNGPTHDIHFSDQHFFLELDGTMTVSKFGKSITRATTENYGHTH